jgi:hypothetical protein
MSRTKIYSVVLNYNRAEETKEAVTSLKKQQGDFDHQIVVVDNSPEQNKTIKKLGSKKAVTLIRPGKNVGYSKGNNQGIKYALKNEADYVCLVNDDAVLEKRCLQTLLNELESRSKAGIASPKIYFAPGYEFHKQRYSDEEQGKVIWYAGGKIDWSNMLASHRGVDEVDKGQFDQVEKTGFASGCVMLIKKQLFSDVGFLDPEYFMYWEDNDFSQRAKNAGYKVLYVGKATAWHKNLGTVKGKKNKSKEKNMARSRLRFGLKYASFKVKLLLLKNYLFNFLF